MSMECEYPPMPKRGWPNKVSDSCYYYMDICGCAWLMPTFDPTCGNPQHCTGKRPADRYMIRAGQLVPFKAELWGMTGTNEPVKEVIAPCPECEGHDPVTGGCDAVGGGLPLLEGDTCGAYVDKEKPAGKRRASPPSPKQMKKVVEGPVIGIHDCGQPIHLTTPGEAWCEQCGCICRIPADKPRDHPGENGWRLCTPELSLECANYDKGKKWPPSPCRAHGGPPMDQLWGMYCPYFYSREKIPVSRDFMYCEICGEQIKADVQELYWHTVARHDSRKHEHRGWLYCPWCREKIDMHLMKRHVAEKHQATASSQSVQKVRKSTKKDILKSYTPGQLLIVKQSAKAHLCKYCGGSMKPGEDAGGYHQGCYMLNLRRKGWHTGLNFKQPVQSTLKEFILKGKKRKVLSGGYDS